MLQVRAQPQPQAFVADGQGAGGVSEFLDISSVFDFIDSQNLKIDAERLSGLNLDLSLSLQCCVLLKWMITSCKTMEELTKRWSLSEGLDLPQHFFAWWDIPEKQQNGTRVKNSSWGSLAPWCLLALSQPLPSFMWWQHERTLVKGQSFPGVCCGSPGVDTQLFLLFFVSVALFLPPGHCQKDLTSYNKKDSKLQRHYLGLPRSSSVFYYSSQISG